MKKGMAVGIQFGLLAASLLLAQSHPPGLIEPAGKTARGGAGKPSAGKTVTDRDAQMGLAVAMGSMHRIVVTTTADTGAGSLREVILKSNSQSGPDTIVFAIPESDAGYDLQKGTWTIQPLAELPAISDSGTFIDGSSQRAFTGGDPNPDGPEIVLNGSKTAGDWIDGLTILSSANRIHHLVVHGFSGYGISLISANAHGNAVTGCVIGISADGESAVPNNVSLYLDKAFGNVIGGITQADRNVVSGNVRSGIVIWIGGRGFNRIVGNFVGIDAKGNRAIPNGDVGVSVYSNFNRIGGSLPGERNVVSGNKLDGIRIGCEGNVVLGN